jgi:hypothetical protein
MRRLDALEAYKTNFAIGAVDPGSKASDWPPKPAATPWQRCTAA